MKIAIIEDEEAHFTLLSSYIKNWSKKSGTGVKILHYENAETFLFHFEEERDFSVLFVDIQMKGMTGMDMAKKVRETDEELVIIFTTGITDYIEEGYEVEAMHYLLKPIKEEKVWECLYKAATRRRQEKCVLVHSGEEVMKVALEKINAVEAMGHGCVLWLAENGRGTEIKESISEMAGMLAGKEFIKCHRSYLCRVGNIHHIDRTTVYFDDGTGIPVSRRLYDSVNQAFIRYFRHMEQPDGMER